MSQQLLSINSIYKSFYNTQALIDVTFDINKGEIVGLLGANGAGKSTLLKIIAGSVIPDSGSITLDGWEVDRFSPQMAINHGVISVYQDLNLFPQLSVAENIFLNKEEKTNFGTVDWRKTNRKAQSVLDEYDLGIKASTLVKNLSYAEQTMVEVARAFNENPKLLLLDEPTSALSESEIEWLFSKIRKVSKEGVTVVFVSHRLNEVSELCERNVILREGEVVHISTGEMEKSSIIPYLVGHELALATETEDKTQDEIVFECKNIVSQDGVSSSQISLRKGEILGVAGLVGSGRTELLNTIFGMEKLISGEIIKNGEEIKIHHPTDAIDNGIILLPEDRELCGLYFDKSACFNISSATLNKRSKFGMVDEEFEKKAVNETASNVMLDTDRLDDYVQELSGGNRQKVVIARILLADADIYLLDEPTRGVDIGTREEIYEIIQALASKGKSIILVTSDWEELIHLCDRALVMSEGRIVGEIEDQITKSKIMQKISDSSAIIQSGTDKKKSRNAQNWFRKLINNRNSHFFVLFFLLVSLLISGSILSPFFRSWINFRNILGQSLPLIILSLGQLIVIISGGIDVSSGALMAAVGMFGQALMLNYNQPPIIGITAMILLSIFVGFLNALLIQKVKLDAFVVTIGMMLIMEGIALVIAPKPLGPSPKVFRDMFNGEVFGLPIALYILIILIIIFTVLLRFTKLGRRFFAVGEDKQKSYNVGINVDNTLYLAYIICSLMSAIAAIYGLGRFGGADPVLGPGLELEAIAIVLIGGATLAGGRGSIPGTISGAFMLGVLANVFSLMDIQVWYRDVLRGVLLLIIISSYERMARDKSI